MTNFKSVFCRNKQVCLFIKIFKIFKCHLMLFDIIILHYCTFSYIMLYQTKLTRIIVAVAERNKIQIIDYAFQYSLYRKKFLCPSFSSIHFQQNVIVQRIRFLRSAKQKKKSLCKVQLSRRRICSLKDFCSVAATFTIVNRMFHRKMINIKIFLKLKNFVLKFIFPI